MKNFRDIKSLEKGKALIKNVGGVKQVKFAGFKVSPSKPTEEQIGKINQFTRRLFTADELYIGQLRLANNCIDRDKERFSEEVIQRFAATALRRTMLFDHNKNSKESAVGKFFDVEVEKLPLQQAITETGEELKLPDGITEVWFLSPWFYIPRAGVDDKIIIKIDAGIYDWGSIGFRAESIVPIMDKDGDIRFWEYRGAGPDTEMTEGSLVYLGAQYGMSVKSADSEEPPEKPGSHKQQHTDIESPAGDINNQGGTKKMKTLIEKLKMLFPKRTFSEENVADEIKTFIDEKDADITAKEARIAELSPLAADGKAYRDGLVIQYVSQKAKLGEVDETPEAQDKVKAVAAVYPIDFLKSEVDALEKRVAEKFPDKPQTKGDDRQDKSEDGKEVDWKKKNPIVPEDDKKEDK